MDTTSMLALKGIYDHPASELVTKQDGETWTFTKQSETIDLAVKFIIDTEGGEKDAWLYQTVDKWTESAGTFDNWVVLQGIIGYPDSRAKECKIYVLDNGVYKRLKTLQLTASKYMNYAYYHADNFEPGEYEGPSKTMLTGGKYWNFNMIACNRF